MSQSELNAYVNARSHKFELQNQTDNRGGRFEKPGVDGLDDIRKDMRQFLENGK